MIVNSEVGNDLQGPLYKVLVLLGTSFCGADQVTFCKHYVLSYMYTVGYF